MVAQKKGETLTYVMSQTEIALVDLFKTDSSLLCTLIISRPISPP